MATSRPSDVRVVPGEGSFDANGIGMVTPGNRPKRSVHGFNPGDGKQGRQPVTRYRRAANGNTTPLAKSDRYDHKRGRWISQGLVHGQSEPTQAEKDQAIAKTAIATHAAGWDQDNS